MIDKTLGFIIYKTMYQEMEPGTSINIIEAAWMKEQESSKRVMELAADAVVDQHEKDYSQQLTG